MGVNLSIKSVPEELAERLRQRAERNHRSLQGELMAIIERAAAEPAPADTLAAAVERRGTKSIEQLAVERRLRPIVSDPSIPRSVDIVRAMRDSRDRSDRKAWPSDPR